MGGIGERSVEDNGTGSFDLNEPFRGGFYTMLLTEEELTPKNSIFSLTFNILRRGDGDILK